MNDIALQVSNVATASAVHAWALAGNFLILVALTLVMIGFSYYGGKGGIISLLISFYVAYALYLVFPYTSFIVNEGSTPLLKAILSVILYAIAMFVPFIFVQRILGGGYGVLSFVPRFVLSFLSATFLLALAYHVFNVTHIYTFPEPMNSLFAPDQYFFWWFIAPFAGLLFLVH